MRILILLFSSLLLSSQTLADTIGFRIGSYTWYTNASGELGQPDFDLEQDMDIDHAYNSVYYGMIEHPIPVLPNLRVSQTNIEHEATSPIFGTKVYIDASHLDVTGYYEILDNIIELDLGLGVRQFNGDISAIAGQPEIDATLPMLYTRAWFNLPLTGLSVGGELMAGSSGSDNSSDMALSIDYVSPIGLGFSLGYRLLSVDVETSNNTTALDADFSGAFGALLFTF